MKNIYNYLKFWMYFHKNINFDYTFYVSCDEQNKKNVRLRVYNAWPKDIYEEPLHDIILPSKSECRDEFLARLDGETPMQIWETWRKPSAEELLEVGNKIWYYGGYIHSLRYEYDIFELTVRDVERQKDNPNYMKANYARVPNRVISI